MQARALVLISCVAFIAGCASLQGTSNSGPTAAVTLPANQAEIVGNNALLEKNPSEEHVGHWDDKATFVRWTVKDLKPGRYLVNAEYAATFPSAGTVVHLQAQGQLLEQTLRPTESWHDYKPLNFGTLDVKSRGDVTVTLKANSKPGRYVMNLKEITLTPAL